MENGIDKYALKVLSENGCDTHTYGDHPVSVEELADELLQVYPNGMDYSHEAVAEAILNISRPSKDHIQQEGFDFLDWGSWGVGDFYPDREAELVAAINSEKPFNTGSHGFKKELQSMRIIRDYEAVYVQCGAWMDEAFEEPALIYDCLDEDEEKNLTDAMISEIRDYLIAGDFVEEVSSEEKLPLNATLEEIMEQAAKLANECEKILLDSFRECIACTLFVMYGESEETLKMIEERQRRLAP